MSRSSLLRYGRFSMRILVIEDEPRILGFLARGLEAEGFAVDGARNGREGLKRAQRDMYDLVLLDLLLPGLDGLSVLRELNRTLPELPFAFDELLARIRVQLRRSTLGSDGHVVRAGTLVLDLARREASLGALTTQLSDREFRVLHHLVEHQGEVISRERLLSEVWGYHFDPGSNVVDVCIRRLRKKLGAGAPIETVRHAGYRLTAA